MNFGKSWWTIVFSFGACALAALGAGCGGGVCGSYCEVGVKCAAELVCEPSDPDAYKNYCVDSCEAGFDAVPATEEAAIKDCLRCFTNSLNDSGSCDPESGFIKDCQDVCATPAVQSGLEKWSEAAGKAQADANLTCTNGRPITGEDASCSASGGGDGTNETCSISCGAAPLVQADCTGPAGGSLTCQCTVGKNEGKSFSSTCNDLFEDSNKVWDACNL